MIRAPVIPEDLEAPAHLRLARNTALSLAAIGLLGASRLAYNVVAGRRFGAAALGEVTLAVNAAMFASLLVSGGWQAATAKYCARAIGAGRHAEAAAIWRRTLVHNTAGGVAIAAACAGVLRFAPGIDVAARDALLGGAIAFAVNGYQHAKASAYGFGLVAGALRYETAASVALVVALVGVAAADRRALLLAPVLAAPAVFSALSYRGVARHVRRAGPAGAQPSGGLPDPAATQPPGGPPPAAAPSGEPPPPAPAGSRLDPALWREIKGFSAMAIGGTLASAGFLNLSVVFAGRYDSKQALGWFAAALALVAPVYFVPRALSLALFPSVAFRFGADRGDAVRASLDRVGGALFAVLLAPVAVAAVGAPILLRLLFGEAYEPGADLLAVMLAAAYLSVVQIPYVTSLSAGERRWYRVPVLASAGGFALGLVLWTTLGPREGAIGVAWGYLIGSVPQAVIPIAYASRVFGVRVAGLGLRAGVVWAAVLAARLALGDRASDLGPVLAACGAVLAVYAVAFGAEVARVAGEAREARSRAPRPTSAPPSTQK